MPSMFSSKARIPDRTRTWSSTSITRIAFIFVFLYRLSCRLRFAHRDGDAHRCAFSRLGPDLQMASGKPGALFHRQDPQARSLNGCCLRRVYVESFPVVMHDQQHVAVLL